MHTKYYKFVISLALILVIVSNGLSVYPTLSGKYIQIGQIANALADDTYTKLLMHFDGSSGSTAFNDEYGKTVTPCGNAHISTAQSKFGGASGYFDGNSYLTIPRSADFELGSEDFTIDCWINISAFSNDDSSNELAIFHGCPISTPDNDTYYLSVSKYYKTLQFACSTNGGTTWNVNLFGTTVLQTNRWYHIAVVRNSSSLKIYLNGIQEASTSISGSIHIPSAYWTYVGIGTYCPGLGSPYRKNFNGYIDELRVSKGIARWTSNFTPSKVPYEPELTNTQADDLYTKLLMHFDGAYGSTLFNDECGKTVTPYGNTQISTVKSKFGVASGYFDGKSYLTVPRSEDFEFGSEDFTIDAWINISAFQNDDGNNPLSVGLAIFHGCPISASDNATYYFFVGKYSKTLEFRCSTIGTSWNFIMHGTTVLQTNTWYHVAVVRNGSSLKMYLNGTQDASINISGSIYAPGYYWTNLTIGVYHTNTGSPYAQKFNGYIDELRVSKGIARWTSNFTPPKVPYGPKLPKPRSSQCTITSNDKIYILGGSNTITGGAIKTVEEYPFTIEVTNTANMLLPCADAGVAQLNDNIYIAGGINNINPKQRCLNTLQVYNPSNESCIEKSSMNISRKALGLAAVNGKIYAFGGVNNTGILDSAEVYNPSDNTWSNLPNKMPVPRACFAITVCGNKIYLIGGYNKDGEYLNSVDVYDPEANTWTTLQTPMLTARTGCEAVTLNNKIYVLGGWNGSYLNTVEIYDPAAEQWMTGNPFIVARTDFGAAVVGTKIYIVGGNNYYAGGYLDSVEVYEGAN